MTNLDRETQKIQKRLAKPQVARLKHKWSKKKRRFKSLGDKWSLCENLAEAVKLVKIETRESLENKYAELSRCNSRLARKGRIFREPSFPSASFQANRDSERSKTSSK
jgi:hypothetical protein